MRQPEGSIHINPAQLKLTHQSPARPSKSTTVLSESYRQPNTEDKSGRRQVNTNKAHLAHVFAQHPSSLNPPHMHQNLMMRTAESGFMINSINTAASGGFGPVNSPSKHGRHNISDFEGKRSSVGKVHGTNVTHSNTFIEGDRKGIVYMNPMAGFPKDRLDVMRVGDKENKLTQVTGLMKCSLQELYDEIYELRQKVRNYEQRNKQVTEREERMKDKERVISGQLDQQKVIFQEYNSRIKALHLSVENYDRRLKDLLNQVSQKEEVNSNLQSVNNKLQIDVTEATVKNNILESQIRKMVFQNNEEFTRMLIMLGDNEPTGEGTLLKQLTEKVDDCVKERDQLKGKCATLEESVKNRVDQISQTKGKVTQALGTCYADISRMTAQITQLKTAASKQEQTGRVRSQQIVTLEGQLNTLTIQNEILIKEFEQTTLVVEELQSSVRKLQELIELIETSIAGEGCKCSTVRSILVNSQTKQCAPAENEKLEELLNSIFQTFTKQP